MTLEVSRVVVVLLAKKGRVMINGVRRFGFEWSMRNIVDEVRSGLEAVPRGKTPQSRLWATHDVLLTFECENDLFFPPWSIHSEMIWQLQSSSISVSCVLFGTSSEMFWLRLAFAPGIAIGTEEKGMFSSANCLGEPAASLFMLHWAFGNWQAWHQHNGVWVRGEAVLSTPQTRKTSSLVKWEAETRKSSAKFRKWDWMMQTLQTACLLNL